MEQANILFLREDAKLDDIIKQCIDLSGMNCQISCADLSRIREYFISCRFGVENTYDIILIEGSATMLTPDDVENLPADSIICLSDIPFEKCQIQWVKDKLFEEIPIGIAAHSPQCLAYAVNRNIKTMKKQYKDQKLVKTLIQLIPNSITLFDIYGTILFNNARLIGLSEESLRGKSIFSFLKRGQRRIIKNYMKLALEDNHSCTFKSEVKTKKGSYTPVEINATLVRDTTGEPLYFIAILTDISIQKEIKRKETYLSHFIDTSKDGILALDRNSYITLWNKGAEELFGYSSQEVLGKNINVIFSDDEIRNALKESLQKVKAEGY
ncbi:MAG: PAS domain-containing protein, partial [Firmicutes bacterium]|nr:PAS domain-containing protein [Bacillota bacterium]